METADESALPEVTPAMLDAAVVAWHELVDSDDPLEWKFEVIYKAMFSAASGAAADSS